MVDLRRKYVQRAKRVVVKIGSRVLSSERGLHSRRIGRLVRELAALHDQGKKLVVVSSGAIASGISRLGLTQRPRELPQSRRWRPWDRSGSWRSTRTPSPATGSTWRSCC